LKILLAKNFKVCRKFLLKEKKNKGIQITDRKTKKKNFNPHKGNLDEGDKTGQKKKKKKFTETAQDRGQKTQQQAHVTTNFIKFRYSEKATKN
jgi:hypothetical protein